MAHAADVLDVERADDVVTMTVDRPNQLNAANETVLDALEDALETAGEEEARVIVLTGAGDDAFVAGADIEYMRSLEPPEALAYARKGHRVCELIESHSAPVIAAVNGYAFGGGCELALAADLRIASENAVIGQPEIDLGIVPGWGGSQRLPALVGDERARRIIYLGQRLDAETALDAGLVGEVVPRDELDERAAELAAELAAKPAFALSTAKASINQGHEAGRSAGLAYERTAFADVFGTHDQREGMDAFLDKRDPDFE